MFSKTVILSIAGQLMKLSWFGSAAIGFLGFSVDGATLTQKAIFAAVIGGWWFFCQLAAHLLIASTEKETEGDDSEQSDDSSQGS